MAPTCRNTIRQLTSKTPIKRESEKVDKIQFQRAGSPRK